MTSKDLGLVTAYAYAVSQGYTGTEEEFAELMASYATVAEEAAESAAEAAASAEAAGASETNAASSAASAGQSATSAGNSATSASGSAVQAQSSATAAGQSATQAAGSATAAGNSATAAAGSASQAAASETAAGASATAAAGSATSASGSATAAAGSATEADASADRAQEILDSIPDDYSELSDDVSDLKSAINILTGGVNKDIVTSFTEGKFYYNYNGNIFEGSSAGYESCSIDAKEGHYYIVYTGVPYNASYYGIIFTNDAGAVLGQYGQEVGAVSVPKLFSCIAPQGTTKAYVNNRNLSVDPFVKESLNVATINDLFDVSLNNSDLAQYLEFARRAVDQANADLGVYQGYIKANGQIKTTTYNAWKLHKYAVTAGTIYKIIGDDVNIYYDVYAVATFSTTDFDGTSDVASASVIIPAGHGATDTDYDVTFTAPSNGYVYISQYSNLNTCYLYETVVNSALINRLTNTKTKTVKMQIFSDSMSDDIWRKTWNNFVADFIPQRGWNIVNCAVGGSGIGHGKSVLPGGRYQDLEYNFVYDLITNPDVFETDNDIVVMFVGTNNYAYPSIGALGEWGDNTSSTFYGAARLICQYVSEHTDALFIVCTPLPRYNEQDSERQVNSEGVPINQDGKTLRDYCDALVQTCHFFHIPVIDLNYEIGWNRYNISNFASDGLHPNAKGAEIVGAYISSILKQHLGI